MPAVGSEEYSLLDATCPDSCWADSWEQLGALPQVAPSLKTQQMHCASQLGVGPFGNFNCFRSTSPRAWALCPVCMQPGLHCVALVIPRSSLLLLAGLALHGLDSLPT